MLQDWINCIPGDGEAPWEAWFAEIQSADAYPYASAIPQESGTFADGLQALLRIHFKPTEHPPFGPMWVMGSQRSMDVSDIGKDQSHLLSALATRINALAPRTRLLDLAWEANKSNREAAEQALCGYLELITAVIAGDLSHDHLGAGVTHQTCGLIRRAASICRQTRNDEADLKVRAIADAAFDSALAKNSSVTHALTLGSEFGLLSDLPRRAACVLDAADTAGNLFSARDRCRAARGSFQREKQRDEVARAAVRASEFSERIADESESAMFASVWLQTALDDLNGIREQKERKTELYRKLISAQEKSMDEFGTIGESTDISDLIDATHEMLEGLPGKDFLRAMFCICRPMPVADLLAEAERLAQQFPLSQLFAPQIVDRAGRVVAKQPNEEHRSGIPPGLLHSVFQNIQMRTGLTAAAQINVARRMAASSDLIYRTDLEELIRSTPFVPPEHQHKFLLALRYFLGGEDLIAGSLVVPCFEDCLRQILKSQGIDTSRRQSDGTQKIATLSVLFDTYGQEIEKIFGPDWLLEAEALFTHSLGVRLRHDWAHGLVSDGAAYSRPATYAIWFILRAALLPALIDPEAAIKTEEA